MNIPVLFLPFSRLSYAREAFEAIKKAKPKKIYFYVDKAREDNLEEISQNNQIKEFVNEVNWECELKTYFRDKNIGIFQSILDAIDWVFENEEQAIILEEDCVASPAFFDFCEQLLTRYKNDWRIWWISGDNFCEEYNPNGYDYIFSRYPYQYGWASWRSRWQTMRKTSIQWEEMKKYDLYRQLYPSKRQAEYQINKDEGNYNYVKKTSCWDLMFGLVCKQEGSFGIVPIKNLVKNIGVKGTHGKGITKFHNRPISISDTYPIVKHPPFVVPDYKYDQYFFYHMYYKDTKLFAKIKRKIKMIFNKIKKI